MKHLLWVVGLISLALGTYFIYQYMYAKAGDTNRSNLIYGGVLFGISLIFWGVFFFRKFREEGEQDISITKF
ncbi:MAG TPA: hypothetical protein VNH22_20150 [Blastocatellia bacterium]|jgi:drug/metabolite transporter (DMT)-like permease|nr:hypothetical protein [Blastocatellia bacterium]